MARTRVDATPAGAPFTRSPRIAIIGAGMSGIGMGAKLRMAGIDDFDVYERWDDVGGTWHANTYPGLSVDVASRYYQFTFAPNKDWSMVYSPGREIKAYLGRVADDFRVRERIRFNTRVTEAEWTGGRWRLRTEDGAEEDYDFLVTAAGALVHPRKPDIPGLEDFAGACFHSAEWDHSVPLAGRRIGVVGTGSTGMQITRALAPIAGRFELYQRTPQWIFPLGNWHYRRPTRWLYRRFPALNRLGYRAWQQFYEASFSTAVVRPGFARTWMQAACRLHLRTIRDPELRRRFTPSDEPMCKRLIMGTGFYKLFEEGRAELVDTGIDHVTAEGVATRDGTLHPLDVLVLATGFDAHAFVRPMELVGPDGVRLSEVWDEEPFGYRSVALPGFPNVLMLIGPHSPFGNQSLFAISESQQDFALDLIDRWRRGEVDALAPTREATDRFNTDLRAAMPRTVWMTGCESWYLGKDGLPHAFPWEPRVHRDLLAELEEADWEVTPGPARPGGPGGPGSASPPPIAA